MEQYYYKWTDAFKYFVPSLMLTAAFCFASPVTAAEPREPSHSLLQVNTIKNPAQLSFLVYYRPYYRPYYYNRPYYRPYYYRPYYFRYRW